MDYFLLKKTPKRTMSAIVRSGGELRKETRLSTETLGQVYQQQKEKKGKTL